MVWLEKKVKSEQEPRTRMTDSRAVHCYSMTKVTKSLAGTVT